MGARIINRQRVVINPSFGGEDYSTLVRLAADTDQDERRADELTQKIRRQGLAATYAYKEDRSGRPRYDLYTNASRRYVELLGRSINPTRVTQRDVNYAAAIYHNNLMQYGENNMATQRAEFTYRDLQRKYAEQQAKRRTNPIDWAEMGMSDLAKQGFMKRRKGRMITKYEVLSDEGLMYHGESRYEAERIARQYQDQNARIQTVKVEEAR